MSDLSFKISATAQDFTKELENVKSQTGNVKKQMRSLTQETNQLEVAYRKLSNSEKNSPFGKYLKEQIDENIKQLADFKDTIGDVQENISRLASDTVIWEGMTEAISVARDSVSAFASSLGISTKEGGIAATALNTLARAQTFANAAITIGNALQKQSKIMSAIVTLQTRAQAAATGKATVAQAAFNLVAKANPYVLLASALIAVTAALASFAIFSSKSAAEKEHENRMLERAKEITDAYYDGLNNSLEETIPKYIRLQTEWGNLRTEAEKIQWLKDNQNEFNGLGVEVENVNDAENFLVNQTENVMNAFLQRAKAMGASTQAAQLYRQALEDIQWLEEHRNDTTLKSDELAEHGFDTSNARIHHHGGALGTGHARYELLDVDSMIRERQKNAEDKIRQLYEDMGRFQADGEKQLTDAGVKAIKDGDKKKNAARTSGKNDTKKIIHENSLEEAEELVKTWEEALKQANINDTELITRINQELEKAKKEVERRKMVLGMDVKVNIVPGSSKDFDNQIKALKDKQDQYALGSADWLDLDEQIKKLENLRRLLTEGITVSGDSFLKNAVSGNFEKTIENYNKAISTLENKMQNMEMGDERWERYSALISNYKEQLQSLSEVYEDSMMTPLEKVQKKNEKIAESITSVGNAIQAAGQLFSELGKAADDEGLQVMGIVAQAVATVALSYAQALTTAKTWVDWLAFGVTGLGTMVSMISTIKSATSGGFANGGIIGGNSFYGDKLLARVNSGEAVLNQKQQKRAYELMDNNMNTGTNVSVSGVIRGRDLVLVAQNEVKYASRGGRNISF